MRAWGLWYGQALANGTCGLSVVGSAELCDDLTGGCWTHRSDLTLTVQPHEVARRERPLDSRMPD